MTQNYYDVTRVFHDMVPLNHVLLQSKISAAVKKYSHGTHVMGQYKFKRDPTSAPIAPLNRLDSMLEEFGKGTRLPPVRVNVRNINGTNYYAVIDGRHRFAASILSNHGFLPVEIVGTF